MARGRRMTAVVASLAASLWMGCGGDGSGNPGSDAGGGGGADSGGGSADGCEPPAGAEIVMPWTAFLDEDGAGGPAYGLLTDGSLLYVNMRDRIITVPLEGGTATEVFRSPEDIPILLTMWGDTDRIVFNDNGTWYELPFGGTPGPATVPVEFASEIFDYDPATDTFYGTDEDFVTDTLNIYSAVVGDITQTVLLANQTVGVGRRWYRSGERFYTQEAQNDDFTAADTIYAFEPGAVAPTLLTLTPAPSTIIGTTSTALYYDSNEDPATWGAYRVAHGGGAAEQIWNSYFFGGLGDKQSSSNRLYGNDATNLWRIEDGQDLVLIAPVPAGDCTTHEVLAHEGHVYTVTYDDDTDRNQVWRVAE